MPVWDYVEETRLPVVVHAGRSPDGVGSGDDLLPLDETARRHPAARIVIAHCGHDHETDAVAILDRHPNVHADLTPVVNRLVQKGGVRKRADAVRDVADRTPRAKEMLLDEMKDRPVMATRAPALHRYSLMAHKPVLRTHTTAATMEEAE